MTNTSDAYEQPLTKWSGFDMLRKEIANNNLERSFKFIQEVINDYPGYATHFYQEKISGLRADYHNNEVSKSLNLSHEDYEISRNQICVSLLELLDTLETDPMLKKRIEFKISLANMEEAITDLINASVGTESYKYAIIISSRFHSLLNEYNGLENKTSNSFSRYINNLFKAFIGAN